MYSNINLANLQASFLILNLDLFNSKDVNILGKVMITYHIKFKEGIKTRVTNNLTFIFKLVISL